MFRRPAAGQVCGASFGPHNNIQISLKDTFEINLLTKKS
jgi:hypothetical protein